MTRALKQDCTSCHTDSGKGWLMEFVRTEGGRFEKKKKKEKREKKTGCSQKEVPAKQSPRLGLHLTSISSVPARDIHTDLKQMSPRKTTHRTSGWRQKRSLSHLMVDRKDSYLCLRTAHPQPHPSKEKASTDIHTCI